MDINWKRIALVLIFLAAVVLFGYLLYFFFLRPAEPTPGVNANVNAVGVLPPSNANANIPVGGNIGLLPPGANVGVTNTNAAPDGPSAPIISPVASGGVTETKVLTQGQAVGATLNATGDNVLFYDPTSGLFNQLDQNGLATPISNEVFFEVESVTWAPNKTQAVLEYPDGANIFYDFKTNNQVTLPAHWKDFAFSPRGDQIIFKSVAKDPENRWLAVSKPDGSSAIKVERLGDKDQTVYPLWSPNNQIVAMYTEAKSLDQQNLFFVGLNSENFKSAIIDGNGFTGTWSTRGDKLLYSVYSSESDSKPNLYIITAQGNAIGQDKRDLKIQTWADKCSFTDNDTVYCAVPQALDAGAGIFPAETNTGPSDIYKINLKTGFKSKVATPENNQPINQLMVDQSGNYLYFTGQTDGKVYQLRLK